MRIPKPSSLNLLILFICTFATIAFSFATATVKIQNKTSGNVAISFSGASNYYFYLGTGKSSVQVNTGQYSYSYLACGETKTGKVNVKANGASIVLLKCSKVTSNSSASSNSTGNCHPSYPTVCIPPPPPDLDCSDIPYRRFRVIGKDPHRFDGDNDGIGCES